MSDDNNGDLSERESSRSALAWLPHRRHAVSWATASLAPWRIGALVAAISCARMLHREGQVNGKEQENHMGPDAFCIVGWR
jgi:hypothetical protein